MQREEITARLAGLSPAKRALLERRRRGEAPAAPVPGIGRRSGAGPAPLSFSQQRMWFLDQLEPGSPAYNLRVVLRLSGPLDAGALTRAFQEVVRRHEVLRTAFREEGGVPVQAVLPHLDLATPVLDLSGLPAALRAEESLRRTRELAVAGFDLSRPPLVRVALVELGASDRHLFVGMHHIVSDGWSMGVLVREVAALYAAFLAEAPLPLPGLPELPIQYADFAVWQRGWLTGEVLERDLGYWRERLAGAATELDLPTDRPRPAVQTSRGAAWRFAFDAGLMAAVEALARREGATPFMVLTAGLLTLLARLSGQEDLTLGSPAAGRNRAETEGLIGFFVNTLVLRADVGSAPDFRALLAHVREVTLGAYAHQDVPFEKLVAEIAPERDMSRTPLFQVAFALQNTQNETVSGATLAGLELRPEQLPVDNAKFDLAFIVGGEGGPLAASLEYATDLFDRTTAARLCGQWLRLLSAATAEPETDLARLELLSAAERHQVLAEWNDTQAPARGDALLHDGFEAHVDLQPEAPAAVWGTESATYRELEARVNRLANFLHGLGAGPGAPVGVWMDRSLDMVVALLGASKAGAAYLPIDAAWPADRAEAVLAGTGAGIVLTRRGHLPAVQALQWRLPNLADAVCLDVAGPQPPPEPVDAAAVQGLFDGVSERAVDWVTAAGFYSAYTGEPFSEAEVLEYRDRVIGLAEPWLLPDPRRKRVLEIGSGSGLILWELAPRVGRYVGLDPSPRTQELNRQRAEREGRGNVEFLTGFAHEVETLEPGSFDLVILASTVQFFPGLNYLERVLGLALERLAPGGAVVVADVLDPRRREDFRRSLAGYAAEHPHSAAARALSRQGEARELYVDPGYFAELQARVLPREEGFANELRFRYDVVIEKAAVPALRTRSKRVWTGWHVAASADARPAPVASPVDIAYVIHTSGSTGAPKGIVVQHRPAVELVRWINSTFRVGPGDRLLFVTSPAFDLSVYDVFGVLAAGGTVHVAPEEALRDPEVMVRLLVEEPVTIWDSAPAALQQLAPLFPARAERSPLRLVLLSGDWIPVKLPDAVRASFPGARVISLGGATEATVWSNWFPIAEVDPRWPSIPYGRPITNARYHVLDRALQPVPVGIPGDLYIGGACLCVGYARLPERTAERFIPDPFAAEPGARLYTTGDRARYGADGNLEFLGRVDQQVKVRGYRIELEEIEAVLARHPGVREAAVVAREDVPGEKRLVGYVVPAAEPAPTAAELRAALQRVMPEYMVPWAFVTLERMPVTANGKLDRKGLPAPRDAAEAEAGYAAPETELERGIAAIWQEVLRLPRVGRHDNFFELGGSSLVATQVVSRLRQAFDVEIPLRTLFEDRTLSGLAQRVEELRGAAPDVADTVPPLTRQPRGAAVPLSFAQQRLWLIDQLEPGSPRYNIAGAARLAGPLDPALLGRILEEVVRRHEVLRTTFALVDGQPVQVIAAERPVPLPVVDLAALPAVEREEEVARRAAAEARLPFDLSQGPLLRAALLRLGDEEHVALLTFHHIVADAWSMGVLFREIADLHRLQSGSQLPQLPVQYADFALWQRGWLQGEALEGQLSYWRRQLAGAPRVLALPTDRHYPAVQTFRGRSAPVALPAALSAAVRELCRQRGATPFMVLLAAWAALLGRYADQEDVLLGTPIAGRNRREIEALIGFFVNTLVMRADMSGAPAFAGLLERVRQTSLDGFARQDVPFERLVEELVPERDLARSPLFQVMFVFQNAPASSLSVPGLTLTPLPVDTGVVKFDLTLTLLEEDEGFRGGLEYSSGLFDGSTVARLWDRFGILLEAAAADPSLPLSGISLLSPAERHQLLVEWGGTREEPAATETLHGRFEARARRRPEAPAVLWEGREMSYGELNRRANQLARRLRQLGVGPESRVGLGAQRSVELAVGILGILKAGGAYVPLDPNYPRERLAHMIEDAGVRVLVGTAESAAALPGTSETVLLDADRELLETLPGGDLPPLADGSSLAYVIYTSGSTGRPKGALVSHGNVVRLFDATAGWFGFDERDVWTLFHSYAFDFSVWELWGALLYGGQVVVVPYEVSRSPERFLDLLVRDRVTVLNQTPSAFTQLARVDEERGGVETDLRLVIFGGEALDVARLAPWFARHGDEEPLLVNMYGITETTVHVTYRPLRVEDTQGERRSVVGVPIPDLSLYVLDRWQQPAPIGVPGELVVGGAGLARGYLGRPELTASRFMPDPVGGRPGARLYRSGDLGRFLPAGEVEYLGRIDHQVKIRGFRIELGEIESVLGSHPGVRECVVVVREEVPGSFVLVGYLTGDDLPEAGALRAFAGQRLPDYMVPSFFVPLAAFPLTPSGKLDRRALPAPERERADETGYAAPSDAVEEALAGLWSEVLGVERVGVRDDFFLLGGHSLLGIQLMSRLRAALGVELSLRELFVAPTVEGLARAVRAAQRNGAGRPLASLARGRWSAGEPLPLSHAQQRFWFLQQLNPASSAFNLSGAVRLSGRLDAAALEAAFGGIVSRHAVVRTRFVAMGGLPCQIVDPPRPFTLPAADLSGLGSAREAELRRLAEAEAHRPFDLAAGTLRVLLVRLAESEHVVLFALHHIAGDGWSLQVLTRELGDLYAAAVQGRPSPLPELPVQYVDWAAAQQEWLRGPGGAEQLAYWRRRLGGELPVLSFPMQRQRPAAPRFRGAARRLSLDTDLSAAVADLGRQEGATLFMVLLAAFEALLHLATGEEDLLVGTNIANRDQPGVEGLIGLFVNDLVLRVDLSGRPGFRELLARVREAAVEAFAHQDLPFEALVADLRPERSAGPLFQAMFVLQGFPMAVRELPGLTLTPLQSEYRTANFDLTLTLGEGPDGISGAFIYDVDLFDASTVARLAEHFVVLLREMVADPDRPLHSLSFEPVAAARQMASAFSEDL